MCTKHSLMIGGTKFTHKDIHKFTWTAPDKKFRTQIEHVLVNTKWMSSLVDTRTCRKANIKI